MVTGTAYVKLGEGDVHLGADCVGDVAFIVMSQASEIIANPGEVEELKPGEHIHSQNDTVIIDLPTKKSCDVLRSLIDIAEKKLGL